MAGYEQRGSTKVAKDDLEGRQDEKQLEFFGSCRQRAAKGAGNPKDVQMLRSKIAVLLRKRQEAQKWEQSPAQQGLVAAARMACLPGNCIFLGSPSLRFGQSPGASSSGSRSKPASKHSESTPLDTRSGRIAAMGKLGELLSHPDELVPMVRLCKGREGPGLASRGLGGGLKSCIRHCSKFAVTK